MENHRLQFTLQDLLAWAEEKPEGEVVAGPGEPARVVIARFIAETNRQQCVRVVDEGDVGLVIYHFDQPMAVLPVPFWDLVDLLEALRGDSEILASTVASEARTVMMR